MDNWRVAYQKVKPNISINYQSIGSGGGVKQFTAKTIDFGASDAPLSEQEQRTAKGSVHIPITIGSVVAAYNIPSIPNKGLKLTGPILAEIFLGKVKKWNDPKIQTINPGLSLPSGNIIVVHRSDGSGTTFVWTDYLSKVSSEWSNKVGKSKSVPWPIGIGAPGNEGIANAIKGTQNTIGYVELAYALTTKTLYANIQNKAGRFIEPSLESTKAAVSALKETVHGHLYQW
jgi:phosphate transport system substrate-binding protein